MSPETGAGTILVAAIAMYAVFGGADFGGGIWTMFATGPRREEQRTAIERAIGPVWETNHVWLILVVVTLFTVFPSGFATIFTALYVPLFLALFGIAARGAAFAVRHYAPRDSDLSRWSLRAFSIASLATPFAFGTIVGAVSSGDITLEGDTVTSGSWTGWTSPFALVCGLIGLSLCAMLAAGFMVPRTRDALLSDFRKRLVVAALLTGVATTVALPLAHANASDFADRLDRIEVAVAMGITAAFGLATVVLASRGAVRIIPLLVAATAAGVVVAWALAVRPDLLVGELTLHGAAAASVTTKSFLISLAAGAVILVPSLALLYFTFSRDVYGGDESGGG